MEQLLHFLGNHWILVAAFILVLLIIVVEELKSQGKGGGTVNVDGAVRMINRDEAGVLDIRSKTLYKQGHIINAINVVADDLESNLNRLKKYQKQPLIVVCERGNSATRVALKLRKAGFEKPMVLAGGIEAWKNANMPISKSK